MTWLQELIPKHIQDLTPYASAKRLSISGEIWLNANENPVTPGLEDQTWDLNRYPDFQPESLLNSYADYSGVGTDQLLVTRGIDEGIDLLIATFCTPGVDNIVYTPPTYGLYKIIAETRGVKASTVPLKEDFQLDIEGLKIISPVNLESRASTGSASIQHVQADTLGYSTPPKLIFLCSPNNPTGNILKRSDVVSVLETVRENALVILDEAYIEYIPEASFIDLLQTYSNLVIFRTLSKAFGLAGLRCGFVVASPEIIQTLRKTIAPYPIPVPVVDLATRALSKRGVQAMRDAVEEANARRQYLELGLGSLSFVEKVYPGEANYVLFKVESKANVMTSLAQAGIIIRDQNHQLGLENCLRITVGSQKEMERLHLALEKFEDTK